MDSRFEGLRHRLEELQIHLLATSKSKISSPSTSSRPKEKNREVESKWTKETHHKSNKSKDTGSINLPNLEEAEAPITPRKKRHQPTTAPAPSQPPPRFQSTISPSKSILNSHPHGDAATVSGLLSRLREEEQKRTSERAALQMQLQKEKQRAQLAETAARRAEDQRDFRLGEVRHLKAALKRRDDVITSLQDQVREMEVGISYADAVQLAQGERDEAKAVLEESQKQLEETSAQLDAALAHAEHARESLRRGEREKARAEERWDRAHAEITRLRDDLHEERNVRAILEQSVAALGDQAIHRQARLRQLLAMGELLSSGDSDENCSVTSTKNTATQDCELSYE